VSLDTCRYQLHTALKTANAHWDDVCPVWDDGVRQAFERDFWNHLEPAVRSAVAALDRLAVAMSQMKQECQARGFSIHGD
jgi:hypothetical protein